MNKKLINIFTLLLITLLSGCATIFTGTTQTINVQTIDKATNQPIPNAACTIQNEQGNTYSIPATPGSVILGKGKGALTVNCTKKGYVQTQVGAGESFNAWTIVNVLFWPGFLVDAATGSIQKYPSHFTVLMEKRTK